MVFVSRALLVAGKSLKEAVRQPKGLAITLGLPLAFMVIFGLAFGGDAASATYEVAVVDEDGGELARAYVQGLRDLAYDDGAPILRVREVATPEDARVGLERRDVDALLVVPRGFTAGLTPTATPPASPLEPAQRAPPEGTSVRVTGDPSAGGYQAASQVLAAYSKAFGERATGQSPAIEVQQEAITSQDLVPFDFIAPGLRIFAILNLLPQGASMLAREVELGTLDRLRQSPAGALNVLGGVALAQLVLAAASLALMLAGARLMGFHNQGSWLSAYAVAMLAVTGVVGVGMLLASVVRTTQEAANFGALISVPASFLSGAFFALPTVDLFTLGGRTIHLYHVLPTTWAVEAMRQTLTFGAGLADVRFALGAMALLSVLFLAAGALLYRRARLAPA